MSFHPEDTTTLRQAFSALADDGDPREVDNERIWQAVRGELSQDERHAVIEEMADNPAMAEAWRIAHALSEELGEDVEAGNHAELDVSTEPEGPGGLVKPFRKATPAVVASPRRGWKTWTTGFAAAAAMLALSIGLSQTQWNSSAVDPIYRNAEDLQIVSQLAEEATLPRDAFTLRWSAIEGARYELRVLRPDLRAVTEAKDLDVAEFRIDVEDLAEITSGTRLLWQVDAHLPDGRTFTSTTFFIELR